MWATSRSSPIFGSVSAFIHESVDRAADSEIGDGTKVWHLAQIREGAVIGRNCVVGRGAYIGAGVHVGDGSKIQNHALVYEPAMLGTGVFVGPAAVLTNDLFPRAVNPDMSPKAADDWHAVGVTVGDGASIGARAVCIAPVTVGRWAVVGAGSVVTRDVPAFALVVGVPARRIGWVGYRGRPLLEVGGGRFKCPVDGLLFEQIDQDTLVEVEKS